jgi:hypothetical protein
VVEEGKKGVALALSLELPWERRGAERICEAVDKVEKFEVPMDAAGIWR